MVGRFPQPAGERGSLKWVQLAVNDPARPLDAAILECLSGASRIDWCSPLASDDYAEYRDAAFLQKVGLEHLSTALSAFWPARGPQWDALARSNGGDVLLVEAKAHIGEICSPPTKAGEASLTRISVALAVTAKALGAQPLAPWERAFYQLANRLAHLRFLRSQGVPAWLVLVNFVGDREMEGPQTGEAWQAAYEVVRHVMGLPKRHSLAPHVIELYQPVSAWDGSSRQSP